MSGITIELVEYNGWKDCVRIDNGVASLIVTTQVGPRILHYALQGQQNVFHEFEWEKGVTGGNEWRLYGGHRLWAGPQVRFRPNEPENAEVKYILHADGVTLTAEIQKESKIQKELHIHMREGESGVTVEHKITSWCVWPIELAVWPVTVMGVDGTAFWSAYAEDTFYLPNDVMVFWPWTKRNDARFHTGEGFMWLRPDAADDSWFKIGVPNRAAWAAYATQNQLFVKRYGYQPQAEYADFGASLEVYCNNEFLELESLGPLARLQQGESAAHTEHWELFGGVKPPATEEEIEALAKAYIK